MASSRAGTAAKSQGPEVRHAEVRRQYSAGGLDQVPPGKDEFGRLGEGEETRKASRTTGEPGSEIPAVGASVPHWASFRANKTTRLLR